MKLARDECVHRFANADHAVFATKHVEGGLHAAPCVFALVGNHIGVPIDLVKPKASTRLIVLRNMEADPEAALVVEQWDRDDWSQLWWVRADARYLPDPDPAIVELLADALEQRYVQYRGRPFASVMVLDVTRFVGWSGEAGTVPTAAPR